MINAWPRAKRVIKEGGVPLLIRKVRQRILPRNSDFIAHPMPKGLPATELVLTICKESESDLRIAKRVMEAYRRAAADEEKFSGPKSYVDSWDDNQPKNHQDLIDALSSEDANRVADYLRNMHKQKATFGVSGNSDDYVNMQSAVERRRRGALIKDILVSFAEALAILPYETIVPYVAKKNIYADPEFLAGEMKKTLGIDIFPPDVDGGLYKFKLKEGGLDERDLWSLYAAWRISELANKERPIAEIGAGMGKVARYSVLFGFKDYTIFDLPAMNSIQGWYLLKTLPENLVQLYGEPKAPMKVMPWWELARTQERYDLVLNQDSFPEINRDVVLGYLKSIKETSRLFLSINHEHQAPLFGGSKERNLVVPQVIRESGGFKKIYRFPFWLRKGYAEELYEVERG